VLANNHLKMMNVGSQFFRN